MADRNALRLAATLALIGVVLYEIVNVFHASGGNDHPAAFTAFANSSIWTAVHLGQFLATAFLTAGLLALSSALNLTAGLPMLVNRLSAAVLVASVALAGVVYAVDGVALKQASDAWLQAPAAEKAARFASAETMRWLEWGIRGYNSVTYGLALLLLATAIVWTARIPRPIGYFLAVNGLASIALGWVVGSAGFTATTNLWFTVSAVATAVWLLWLLIVAWWLRRSVPAAGG